MSKLERERLELEWMVDRLGRSKRLSGLLRYLGESYFRCESAQMCEYNIATAVFGRTESFNPAEDAIARVEAHRLRKKLKEFYESEGANRPVQITIPLGSYAPRFIHNEPRFYPDRDKSSRKEASTSPEARPTTSLAVATNILPGRQRRPSLGAVSLGLTAVIGAFLSTHQGGVANMTQSLANHSLRDPVVLPPASDAVRILCGYSGQFRLENLNESWLADRDYRGGQPVSNSSKFTARTNRPWLFESARSGDFTYDIPLKAGCYELHLYFDETMYGPGLGGGEQSRTFSVKVNDELRLTDFDIESDALGPNTADERVFTGVTPAKDGKLHIAFARGAGPALLSALAVIPSSSRCMLPVRIVAQPSSAIDQTGNLWRADDYNFGGLSSSKRSVVTGTPDPGLYAMERFGHFNYAIPVPTGRSYTLNLHFAEYYFGGQISGVGGPGSRVFDVTCNNVNLVEHFDIFKEVGVLRALIKSFHHLAPTAQGKLNLTFEPVNNYASVSAIEVLDESE